ncbi:MAG: hypothetical protein IJ240_00515 [Clostridia bacterium]|nr:hypothetical protein [Clostridia bacterium]
MKPCIKRLKRRRRLYLVFLMLTVLLLLAAGWLYYSGRADRAWIAVGLAALSLLSTVPVAREYRDAWLDAHTELAYGRFAESVDREARPEINADQVRMLCLFPLAEDDRAVVWKNRVSASCRGHVLTVTEASLPIVHEGGRVRETPGCLIHMDMPRSPASRLRLVGEELMAPEAGVPFFRNYARLYRQEWPLLPKGTALFADGMPNEETLRQIAYLLGTNGKKIALSIEGRTMDLFVAGAMALNAPPAGPRRIVENELSLMPFNELPRALDLAFDTVGYRLQPDPGNQP